LMSSLSPRHAPTSVSLLASAVHPSPSHVLRPFVAPSDPVRAARPWFATPRRRLPLYSSGGLVRLGVGQWPHRVLPMASRFLRRFVHRGPSPQGVRQGGSACGPPD